MGVCGQVQGGTFYEVTVQRRCVAPGVCFIAAVLICLVTVLISSCSHVWSEHTSFREACLTQNGFAIGAVELRKL